LNTAPEPCRSAQARRRALGGTRGSARVIRSAGRGSAAQVNALPPTCARPACGARCWLQTIAAGAAHSCPPTRSPGRRLQLAADHPPIRSKQATRHHASGMRAQLIPMLAAWRPPLQGPCWAHGMTATPLPACSSAWARRGAPAQTAMHAPTGCTASSPQATRDRCTHGTQSPPLHSARPARQGAPWRSTRSRPVGAGRPELPSPNGASRITGRADQFQVMLAMCMSMHMQCSHGPRHAGLRSELRPVGAEAARVAGCRLQAEQDRHGAAGPDATAPMPPQRGPSARPRPRRRTGYGARSAAPATSAATGRHWPG